MIRGATQYQPPTAQAAPQLSATPPLHSAIDSAKDSDKATILGLIEKTHGPEELKLALISLARRKTKQDSPMDKMLFRELFVALMPKFTDQKQYFGTLSEAVFKDCLEIYLRQPTITRPDKIVEFICQQADAKASPADAVLYLENIICKEHGLKWYFNQELPLRKPNHASQFFPLFENYLTKPLVQKLIQMRSKAAQAADAAASPQAGDRDKDEKATKPVVQEEKRDLRWHMQFSTDIPELKRMIEQASASESLLQLDASGRNILHYLLERKKVKDSTWVSAFLLTNDQFRELLVTVMLRCKESEFPDADRAAINSKITKPYKIIESIINESKKKDALTALDYLWSDINGDNALKVFINQDARLYKSIRSETSRRRADPESNAVACLHRYAAIHDAKNVKRYLDAKVDPNATNNPGWGTALHKTITSNDPDKGEWLGTVAALCDHPGINPTIKGHVTTDAGFVYMREIPRRVLLTGVFHKKHSKHKDFMVVYAKLIRSEYRWAWRQEQRKKPEKDTHADGKQLQATPRDREHKEAKVALSAPSLEFIAAILAKDKDKISALVSEHADNLREILNARDEHDMSAAMYAVESARTECLEILLSTGQADFLAENQYGESVAILIGRYGFERCLDTLLPHIEKLPPIKRNIAFQDILFASITSGNLVTFEKIIQHRINDQPVVDLATAKSEKGDSVIELALRMLSHPHPVGDPEKIVIILMASPYMTKEIFEAAEKKLATEGQDMRHLKSRIRDYLVGEEKSTELGPFVRYLCAQKGTNHALQFVDKLLDNKDKNHCYLGDYLFESKGILPTLSFSISKGFTQEPSKAFKILKAKRQQFSEGINKTNPFFLISQYDDEGSIASLTSLVKDKERFNEKGNNDQTAIMKAAAHGHAKCLRALLDFAHANDIEIDLFALNKNGESAFSLAVWSEKDDCIRYLCRFVRMKTPSKLKEARAAICFAAIEGDKLSILEISVNAISRDGSEIKCANALTEFKDAQGKSLMEVALMRLDEKLCPTVVGSRASAAFTLMKSPKMTQAIFDQAVAKCVAQKQEMKSVKSTILAYILNVYVTKLCQSEGGVACAITFLQNLMKGTGEFQKTFIHQYLSGDGKEIQAKITALEKLLPKSKPEAKDEEEKSRLGKSLEAVAQGQGTRAPVGGHLASGTVYKETGPWPQPSVPPQSVSKLIS